MAAPLVLIVDDHPDTNELYASYLTFRGFRVISASNGLEAIALTLEHAPDVIVTDVALPGMDGVALIRHLRGDAATADTPILVISGSSHPLTQQQLAALGVAIFLMKPILPDDLCTRIETALGLV